MIAELTAVISQHITITIW